MRNPSQLRRKLWPFGLLVFAWFCANLPHSVALDLFSWARDAGHFSHQAQLRAETFAALTGAKPDAADAYASSPAPVKRLPTTLPSDGMTKKTELLFAHDTRVLGNIDSESVKYRDDLSGPPETWKGDTPHPPPRSGV